MHNQRSLPPIEEPVRFFPQFMCTSNGEWVDEYVVHPLEVVPPWTFWKVPRGSRRFLMAFHTTMEGTERQKPSSRSLHCKASELGSLGTKFFFLLPRHTKTHIIQWGHGYRRYWWKDYKKRTPWGKCLFGTPTVRGKRKVTYNDQELGLKHVKTVAPMANKTHK